METSDEDDDDDGDAKHELEKQPGTSDDKNVSDCDDEDHMDDVRSARLQQNVAATESSASDLSENASDVVCSVSEGGTTAGVSTPTVPTNGYSGARAHGSENASNAELVQHAWSAFRSCLPAAGLDDPRTTAQVRSVVFG